MGCSLHGQHKPVAESAERIAPPTTLALIIKYSVGFSEKYTA